MTIEKRLEGRCLTLVVGGRLDANTAPELEAELKLDGVRRVRNRRPEFRFRR